jgi:hypothetical protein
MGEQTKEASSRVRCYLLSHEMFYTQFHEGTTVRVMRGLPDGARVLGVHPDYLRQAIAVMVEHPSFDPVPLGEQAPLHMIAVEDVSGRLHWSELEQWKDV